MAYVAGLNATEYAPEDIDAKTQLYNGIQNMTREFQSQFGAVSCRTLLEQANCAASTAPSPRTADYYAERPCARLVAAAAEIIDASLVRAART
jgi:hypothetical protein